MTAKYSTINMRSVSNRVVLFKISHVLEWLGLICHTVVTSKIIMQEIWISKFKWENKLKNPTKPLPSLFDLRVPCYSLYNSNPNTLHIQSFYDTSMRTYCARTYFRAVYPSKIVSCHLIPSNCCVAPFCTNVLINWNCEVYYFLVNYFELWKELYMVLRK